MLLERYKIALTESGMPSKQVEIKLKSAPIYIPMLQEYIAKRELMNNKKYARFF